MASDANTSLPHTWQHHLGPNCSQGNTDMLKLTLLPGQHHHDDTSYCVSIVIMILAQHEVLIL